MEVHNFVGTRIGSRSWNWPLAETEIVTCTVLLFSFKVVHVL
jgi:hypothetical protein